MAKDKTKSIYHWVICLMTLLMMFTCCLVSSGFSLMVNAVKEYAGLSGSASSLIFTVKNLSALVFVFFADKYYQKLGLRIGITGALVLGALCMFICMIAGTNVMIYYLAGIVGGAAYAFGMILPMSLLIRTWFNKDRALAMGIASTGTGLSGLIMSPIAQAIIDNYGVSAAFMFEIVVFLAVGVVFFLVVRNSPEEVGLEPYGGENYVEGTSSKNGDDKPAKQVKMSGTWALLFILAAGLMGFGSPPVQQHFVLHFNNLGYDSMLVASAYALCGGTLIISKLAFGALSSKMHFGTLSILFLIAYVISTGLAFVSGFMMLSILPFVTCVVFGIAGAVCSLGYPNWIADVTTKEEYAKKVKNAQSAYQGCEVIGSFVPGLICDLTGHYSLYYLIAMFVFIAIAVIVYFGYKARDRALRAAENEAVPAAE